MRKIKISEEQKSDKRICKLLEDENEFTYLTDNPIQSYDGQAHVSVAGKFDAQEDGEPLTGDKIGDIRIPQQYYIYNRSGGYGNRAMHESNDKNNDGVDDFYNHAPLNILNDGDDDNNLVRIPSGIDRYVDILIDKTKGLNPKQCAMVLNKLIMKLDISSIPYSWKRELILKLKQ